MGILSVTTFVTADGIMQAPGGSSEDTSGGFTHGGWVMPHFDEALGAFMGAVFMEADAFVLGRGTYEIFAGHWPKVDEPLDPVATGLNTLPKHVASRTLTELSWQNSHLLGPVLKDAVEALKPAYAREIQVHGSPGLIQSLLADDLVDKFNIIQFPVLLGTGKRLFGAGTTPVGLRLASSQITPTGVIIATYVRDGAVKLMDVPSADGGA